MGDYTRPWAIIASGILLRRPSPNPNPIFLHDPYQAGPVSTTFNRIHNDSSKM